MGARTARRRGGGGPGPKSLETAEDWAPYGFGGEPDEDGWYPRYRQVPEELKPHAVTPVVSGPKLDTSWLAIVSHWRIVVAELMERGVDIYDAETRARPWMGVRALIFSLIDSDTRLRAALRRDTDGEERSR